MPITVLANELLRRPTLRLLIEIGATAGVALPVALPVELVGEAAIRMSTDALYAPAGGPFYEARIQGVPQMALRLPSDFGGTQAVESIAWVAGNGDGALTHLRAQENRGRSVVAHLYDVETGELRENFFVGQLAQPRQQRRLMAFLATATDVARMQDKVPETKTSSTRFPTAQDGGSVWPFGQGVVLHVPCRNVKSRLTVADPSEYDYVCLSGNWGIDRVWEGGLPILAPEGIVTDERQAYQRLYRTYMDAVGRWATVLRFTSRQAAQLSGQALLPIVVDAQRYPDMDEHVVGEFKWKGTFGDDATPINATTDGTGGGGDGGGGGGGAGGGGGTGGPQAAGAVLVATAACDFAVEVEIGGGTTTEPPPSGGDFSHYRHVDAAAESWYPAGVLCGSPESGTWISQAQNRLFALPFLLPTAHRVAKIGLYLASAGSAGGVARMGIYAAKSGTDVYPGSLVVDGGTVNEFAIDDVAAPKKEHVVDVDLPADTLHWLVVVYSSATAPQTRRFQNYGALKVLGCAQPTSIGTAAPDCGLWVSFTYGALPSTFPGSPTFLANGSIIPFLGFTLSS